MHEISERSVSPAAFDVLWQAVLPHEPLPTVLSAPSPGDTDAERRRIELDAWGELRRAGLAGHRSAHPEVADALWRLRRPRAAVDIRWFEVRETSLYEAPVRDKIGVRVAVDGSWSVSCKRHRDTVELRTKMDSDLVGGVIAQIGGQWTPPRRFSGTVVHLADLRTPSPAEAAYADPLRNATGPALPADLLGGFSRRLAVQVVVPRPVLGRDSASTTIVVNDTAEGRYVVVPDGATIAILPGSRVTFERKLGELIKSMTRR